MLTNAEMKERARIAELEEALRRCRYALAALNGRMITLSEALGGRTTIDVWDEMRQASRALRISEDEGI